MSVGILWERGQRPESVGKLWGADTRMRTVSAASSYPKVRVRRTKSFC